MNSDVKIINTSNKETTQTEFNLSMIKRTLLLFLLSLISLPGFSQSPTYELRVTNQSQPAPNIYEFEVFLLNTSQYVFELQTLQFGIGYDTLVLNGGTTTNSIVTVINGNPLLPAPSELNSNQVPIQFPPGLVVSTANGYPGTNFRYFNVAARTPPGAGAGTIISTVDGGCPHPGTRVGRFRMTNSVPFRNNSTFRHIWSTGSGPNKTATIVQAYLVGVLFAANITNYPSHINFNNPNSCITVVLPIELISFDAKLISKKVNLSWATSSEINNDYFTVERSVDGENFNELFRVDGAGNSTTTNYYTKIDEDPLPGYSFYRLRQTDFDGNFTFSETIRIYNNNSNIDGFEIQSITPNPFSSELKIEVTSNSKNNIEYTLIGPKGENVKRGTASLQKGMSEIKLEDLQTLSNGIYLIILFDGEKRISAKVIKN